MSRPDAVLSAGAIRLVLAALEAPQARLSPAVFQQRKEDAARLSEAGIINPGGHEPVITAADDFSDTPLTASWNPERERFGYFSEVHGWREIRHHDVMPYDVDVSRFMTVLVQKCDLSGKAEELVPAHLWQLGFLRLGTRPKRIPLLYGRRLHDDDIRRKVENLARDRPSDQRRIILTSTRINLSSDIRGCTLIAIIDALRSHAGLAVDPAMVARRYDQMPAINPDEPLLVLREGAEVRLLGRTFHFRRGAKQREIICYMNKRYLQGHRWTSSTEIAVEVGLADTTRVRDVFKKNPAWDNLLTERDGMCGFCLPEAG